MAKGPYRTIVFIDGFNFYYGSVRGTLWKWLDIEALFRKVLGPQNALVKIKYFTARVQPSPNVYGAQIDVLPDLDGRAGQAMAAIRQERQYWCSYRTEYGSNQSAFAPESLTTLLQRPSSDLM